LQQAGISRAGRLTVAVRERLPGAWDWDGKSRGDQHVRWPLRPIWFGGPGPAAFHNRKFRGQTLAAAHGRYFVNGDGRVTALDAYNGHVLWQRPIPRQSKSMGASLRADADTVYYTVDKSVFDGRGPGCFLLDARTGRQRQVYAPYQEPAAVSLQSNQRWELKHLGQTTLGTAALTTTEDTLTLTLESAAGSATKSWDWELMLDFRPLPRRYGLFDLGTWHYHLLPEDPTARAHWRAGKGTAHPPLSVVVTPTGKRTRTTVTLSWREIADAAGVEQSSDSFGFALTLSERARDPREPTALLPDPARAAFLFGNTHSNGINNGWANVYRGAAPAATSGGTAASADDLLALGDDDDDDDDLLGGAPSATTPAVVAGTVDSGKGSGMGALDTIGPDRWRPARQSIDRGAFSDTRLHPLTGQEVMKNWKKGFGCSGVGASATSLFTRAGDIGIYDFAEDSGLHNFGGMRPSCGNSLMAALGLLYISEGGSGCECTYNLQTGVALAPAERRLHEDWALFYEAPVDSVIRQAALNLGAPGDRRDGDGRLWLGVPRPDARERVTTFGAGTVSFRVGVGVSNTPKPRVLPVDAVFDCSDGGGPYRVNADRVQIAGTQRPWLYASGVGGLRKMTLKLAYAEPLQAVPVKTALVADGAADERLWQAPPAVTLPDTQGEVRLGFDDDQLYIACRRPTVVDRKGGVRKWGAAAQGRDFVRLHFDDVWELWLSDASRRATLHLAVSASAAYLDARAEGDHKENLKWDGAWERGVRADESCSSTSRLVSTRRWLRRWSAWAPVAARAAAASCHWGWARRRYRRRGNTMSTCTSPRSRQSPLAPAFSMFTCKAPACSRSWTSSPRRRDISGR
jgi:hypothetical protein